ncbi:MAG TPA: hypothetical protein PLC54_04500, partial [Spirochaetales bacterium]|nr:hypothetical protein [Spirochaetales bacterium]
MNHSTATHRQQLHPALLNDMLSKGIDVDKSLSLLQAINDGSLSAQAATKSSTAAGALRIPPLDGKRIVDVHGMKEFRLPAKHALQRLSELQESLPPTARSEGSDLVFDRPALVSLGQRLLGQAAWGVLNGGSATSYADRKKNQSMGAEVFSAIQSGFELLAPLCDGTPKGLSPAYINPDGSPGESFLVLKMRAALRVARGVAAQRGSDVRRPVLPFFQMTSPATNGSLARAYGSWDKHPWLVSLGTDGCADPRKPL